MEKPDFIIGVDVSRNTLDIHCAEKHEHIKIKNGTEGFREFSKWCKLLGIDLGRAIIAMEYTGGYEYKLVQYCMSKRIAFIRLSGLAIKRSLGIIRGKNDKVDSGRIAQYVDEKCKSLEPSKPVDMRIVHLKELLHYRKRIVRESAGYKASIKERLHIYVNRKPDLIIRESERKIELNKKTIIKVEKAIMKIIESDEGFNFNYELLTSITGIGKVNAWMTIAFTENFTSFPDARTYAVYVGVIPFDHSSGTSVHKNKRVSRLANKWIKAELSQAAKSAYCWDDEIREYGEKKLKTKSWGKVMNNIKFKLILRMFSVVKRGEKYVENYRKAA